TATTTKSTPKKRRHSEYHDPDYGYGSPIASKQKRIKEEQDTDEEKAAAGPALDSVAQLKRIEEIVRAEFQRELHAKEKQLGEIDARLLQARQLLDKLRYHVVSEYYRKQQVPLTAADVSRVRSADTLFGDGVESGGAQLPLHPAIKKIVGKRPAPMQLHLPERTAATLAKQTIRLRNPAHRRAERRRQQKIREQGIVTDHSQEPAKQPDVSRLRDDEQPSTSRQAAVRRQQQQQQEDAAVAALNASRLNNKNKFHFVVGNTSKYVGQRADADAQGANQALAYKWLVYVQGKNLPRPPEAYLKKVRFQLHHSYRPNDIVDVHAPPFQLTRRGWGEFPMRIQLYFQEHLQQKPVQLMHNIVLDKTMCGLHTMGGETTVEVWLRADAALMPEPIVPVAAKEPLLSPVDNSKPRTISITQNKEELDDNLFACLNKIELPDDIEQIEPTLRVSEPLKLSSPKKLPPAPVTPQKIRLDAPDPEPVSPVGHAPVFGNGSCKRPQLANGHAKPAAKNVVFQKAGKLYIIDPLQSKLKQQSLLKPQVSLLKQSKPLKQSLSKRWHLLQCIQNDHGYANMSSLELPLAPTVPQSQRVCLEQLFNRIHFQSMRTAVEFLLRRLPLTGCALGKEFAFGSHTPTSFLAQPALRQRFFEYMRGRALLRCMRQHRRLQHLNSSGKEHFWSVREIMAFARLHGYTPPLKLLSVSREKASSALAPLSQRVLQQLKEAPQAQLLAYCSLSPRKHLDSWLAEQLLRLQSREQQLEEQQLIDVLGVDAAESRRTRPAPSALSSNPMYRQQTLYLPPPEELDTAAQLVRDMCKDVGIVLDTEQSVPGVSQSLALTLLAHVLRVFVEKLVRRAVAAKLHQQQQQLQQQAHPIETLPPAAANVDMALLPYDIGRVIAKCAELDFLGNCHLGVAHSDASG
ncbi:hypothetical protein KR222_001764, partial [Zaprionus bogoriensis]